ncbi:GIY-YIG nuclease family protein [Sphingobacterium sp. DN00404]|uniref:Excinuclease cho n=1 Tax=Sphingobacterium micropteri TaxID=2763501 RepID=A0ABR7YUC6_9SPHI|nr:GIY-YIG nuclease family protein [Sphingobacterium micropteri]MBD1434954.1 GIY-YIG nuclease family protein [Sphingobacterium micropteri]
MTAELQAMIERLPGLPGVYFFYTQHDDLVYIGKSIHIRKRVQQHFQGKDSKSRKIQRTVTRIAYEPMGSELISLLYESDLIKRHQPLYNCTQRRTMDPFGLYIQHENGYKALHIANNQERGDEIITFAGMTEAKNTLYRLTEKYKLCPKINGLYKTRSACFHYQIKSCYGACIDQEPPESYNQRVDTFLHAHRFERFTKLFEVEGRSSAEKGLVYIERGIYRGFGFCARETPGDQLLKYISYRADNKDVRRILMRYMISG